MSRYSNISSKLHNTYCMSIYGSQLWTFNRLSSAINFICMERNSKKNMENELSHAQRIN